MIFLTFQILFADFEYQIRENIQLLRIKRFLTNYQENNSKTCSYILSQIVVRKEGVINML